MPIDNSFPKNVAKAFSALEVPMEELSESFMLAGRSMKSVSYVFELLNYMQGSNKDEKLLNETEDIDLPLLINRKWATPRTKRLYGNRVASAKV